MPCSLLAMSCNLRPFLMQRFSILLALGLSWPVPALAQSPLTLADVVKTTLERHPEVRLGQAQVEANRGLAVQQAAPFDTVTSAGLSQTHTEVPIVASDRIGAERQVNTDSTALGLSSVTGTRWGMTIEPAITIERLHQRVRPGVGGLPVRNQATVGVQLTQNLLRGRGRARAAGEEIAAKREAEAAGDDLRFIGSQRSLETVVAYWRLVGARRQLALYEGSEALAAQLASDTQALVAGNQRPAADQHPVEGNLADRRRALNQARATEFEAQRLLGLAMGIPASEMDNLTQLAHALPARPTAAAALLTPDDVTRALKERADLAAAELRVRAAQARRTAADGNRMPALNLGVGAGYSGATDDSGFGPYLASLGQQVPGIGVNASLTLELPVLNKAREGAYLQRTAEQSAAAITRDENRRQISTRVRIARNNVERAVQTLEAADRAADLYAQAVDDERTKLRAGLATVIDVVVVQDRLLQVQLSQLDAQVNYAEALAEYHFELGGLPETSAEADETRLSPLLGPTP